MGKGSTPRPFDVPMQKFAENWDKIFGAKKEKEKPDQRDHPDKGKK